MPTDTDQPIEIDDAAKAIDETLNRLRRGVLTTIEATTHVTNTVMSFIRWSLDNAAIELVIDYGRDAVERLASCRGHLVEPVLLDWYDQKVVDGGRPRKPRPVCNSCSSRPSSRRRAAPRGDSTQSASCAARATIRIVAC